VEPLSTYKPLRSAELTPRRRRRRRRKKKKKKKKKKKTKNSNISNVTMCPVSRSRCATQKSNFKSFG